MPAFQQVIQISFHLARVGYHEAPIWETRILNPCKDEAEAYNKVREEFPADEYDVWDVHYDSHMVTVK